MMNHDTALLFDSPRRVGHIVLPDVLKTVIPRGQIGAYLLLNNGKPIYIGRSDHCILTRLLRHERIKNATHVVWEPCKSVDQAFALEAAWYHHPQIGGSLINQIHPARPKGYQGDCPFCKGKDDNALVFALSSPKPEPAFVEHDCGERQNS